VANRVDSLKVLINTVHKNNLFIKYEHAIFVNSMRDDLINIAVENLSKEVPFKIKYHSNKTLDGKIEIKKGNNKYQLVAEIKNEINSHHLHQAQDFHENRNPIILIAERITPKMRKVLRDENINYLETNGNAFINIPDIFLLIDTKKTFPNIKQTGNRAFTKTGLKVLFHFLIKKELINQPQREIAEISGVSLGSIPQIIKGLKETGYLLRLKKDEYIWENRNDLLERWITNYQTTLKPNIKKGTFTMKLPWNEIVTKDNITVWGGEPAADILTNHLRPEKFLLYSKETLLELIRNYKLMPNQNGELEIHDLFWNQSDYKNTAPPLLIYTELILEGGKRNKETAIKIFNEYVKPKL
jgi:hypothetical protein